MKIVGLIAEYNPFHNGHQYHIEKAKQLTGADQVLVIMSGNFVQRGMPAIMSKYLRTRCALDSGASAVVELPVCYSCGSAEYFAEGAISLLTSLGCVDSICFGSECGNLEVLDQIAEILTTEPEIYRNTLKDGLKQGLSFPAARQHALISYSAVCGHSFDPSLLSAPNNILGIEYLKALKKLGSSIKPYTIQRTGSGYHETVLHPSFSSATAIRESLSGSLSDSLKQQIPDSCFSLMAEIYDKNFPVTAEDFSLLLKAKLLGETKESLVFYADMNQELANRIINKRNDFQTIEQFCNLLKTRELTYSRISRCLFHLLLGITQEHLLSFRKQGAVFYARILGFDHRSAELLSLMKKNSRIPLITKPSQGKRLKESGLIMFLQDCYSADLYESVVSHKFHTAFTNELAKPIVKI